MFIYFSILLMITYLILGQTSSEGEEKIKTIYQNCRQETQIEDSEIETFRKMEVPATAKGKCMMGCLMRGASIIVNGKFNQEGAFKVAEHYYEATQENMAKARHVIDICGKKIENETDECEMASKIAECIIEESQKNGLSFRSE